MDKELQRAAGNVWCLCVEMEYLRVGGEGRRVGSKEILGIGGNHDDERGRVVGAYVERSYKHVYLGL